MTGRMGDDRGSATVWVLALSGVLLSLGAAAVVVLTAVAARHQAEAAADLAALAAAGSAVSGSADPCAAAASIASANRAVLQACSVDAGDVVQVRVGVRVTLASLGVRWAHASARAGPVLPGG